MRPKGHACLCATFLVFFSATMPNVMDLSVDELKCISTYTIVEDCLMLMMALGLSVWKAGVNVDGTRTVDRNSPLHCALLSSYKHHLQCHHVQYARTPCSCTQCSRTRTEEAGMSKILSALGPDGLMDGPWDLYLLLHLSLASLVCPFVGCFDWLNGTGRAYRWIVP